MGSFVDVDSGLSDVGDRLSALLVEGCSFGFSLGLVREVRGIFDGLVGDDADYWRYRIVSAFVQSIAEGLVGDDVVEVAGLISVVECW